MASPVEQVTRMADRRDPARGRVAHYLLAALMTRTADEGARVALVVLALDRTGSAAVAGTLVATLLIPHVVAAPVVGALVDRARRPSAVLAGAIAIFAACLAAPVLLLGRAPVALAYLALAVAGSCGPAITGGLTSRLAALAGPERESRAFGLDSLFYNIASMAGPAAVGLVAAWAGPGAATVMLAVTAGLGALGVLTLHLPALAVATDARAGLLSGAREIAKDPGLRVLTLTTSLGQIGPGALPIVATTLAVTAHRPAIGGLLLSAVAGGALLGSLLWIWRPISPERAAGATAWAMIGIGVPLAAAAATDSLPLTGALFGLSGLFIGPYASALFLARNRLAADATRAQVFTIGAGLKVTASALGAALIGFAGHLPVSTQLLLVAASPIIAGTAGRVLQRRHHGKRAALHP